MLFFLCLCCCCWWNFPPSAAVTDEGKKLTANNKRKIINFIIISEIVMEWGRWEIESESEAHTSLCVICYHEVCSKHVSSSFIQIYVTFDYFGWPISVLSTQLYQWIFYCQLTQNITSMMMREKSTPSP